MQNQMNRYSTRRPRGGFTLIELVVSFGLMSVLVAVAWNVYVGGSTQAVTAGDHLTATQSAMVLMESIQEDIRQMAILNQPGTFLIPHSLLFSTNGKSFMLRKSALTNTDDEMRGSAFTVVIYQIIEHPTYPGLFTIRRLERTTNGENIPSKGRAFDEKVFASLLLKDIRFDLIVKLEQMVPYRSFVRVSISAASGPAGRNESKVYLVSNMFEVSSPQFINVRPNQSGFARRFLISATVSLIGSEVTAGPGFYNILPPNDWPDWGLFAPFMDYIDKNGNPADFEVPEAAAAVEPFAMTDLGLASSLRNHYVKTGTEYIRDKFGLDFRGRILGQVTAARPADGSPPPWVAPFDIDATSSATESVAVQINHFLDQTIIQGPEAVEQMGHLLFAYCYPGGLRPNGQTSFMVMPADAQSIVNGQ